MSNDIQGTQPHGDDMKKDLISHQLVHYLEARGVAKEIGDQF